MRNHFRILARAWPVPSFAEAPPSLKVCERSACMSEFRCKVCRKPAVVLWLFCRFPPPAWELAAFDDSQIPAPVPACTARRSYRRAWAISTGS